MGKRIFLFLLTNLIDGRSGDPQLKWVRMLGALRRLAVNRELVDTRHQALATMKVNDLPGWAALFSTHPPLAGRIASLQNQR